MKKRIVLFFNSTQTFFWHRKDLADHLISLGHDVHLLCPLDNESHLLKNSSYQVHFLDLDRKGKNPLSELKLLWNIVGKLRRISPDICHNFTIKCVIYGSLASRFVGSYKVVSTITGLGAVFIKGGWLQRIVEFLYKVAFAVSDSAIIFQNRQDHDLFLSRNLFSKNTIKLIPGSGVDTQEIQPVIKNWEKPTVLIGSRLLKTKGIIELLTAAAELTQIQFLIAGDLDPGNPDSLTEADLIPFKSLRHIRFLGQVPIVPLLKEATIGCLPSYREGMPKFLLECAAAGLPIVTTDAPGCRDVIDGNGILVPIGSASSIQNALDDLAKKPDLCETMGRRSRQLAETRFASTKIISDIVSLYNL